MSVNSSHKGCYLGVSLELVVKIPMSFPKKQHILDLNSVLPIPHFAFSLLNPPSTSTPEPRIIFPFLSSLVSSIINYITITHPTHLPIANRVVETASFRQNSNARLIPPTFFLPPKIHLPPNSPNSQDPPNSQEKAAEHSRQTPIAL